MEPHVDRGPASDPRPAPRVESPRPADRGLVARLLETVVADDPSVAPAVASGSVRAAQWLQQVRPDWQGVAVVEEAGVRRVVGYVAATSGSPGAPGSERVLVHPDHRGSGLEEALVAAAGTALATAPPPAPVAEPEPEPELVRVAPAPTTWRQRLTEPAGAVAIVVAGLAAVLAVQVGAGPLSDVVPFLDRDRDRRTSADGGGDGGPDAGPTAGPPAPSDPTGPSTTVPGVVLTPIAAPDPGAGGPDPDSPGPGPGSSPGGPTAPPSTPPSTPPTTPPRSGGPTSALLDPVVGEVVEVVDAASGNAATPVTGAVRDVVDTVTDVLDGALGALVPPRP